jgi:hypothetical protein
MKKPTDKQLLDFLQSKTTGFGRGWIARMSGLGRGYRLHETDEHAEHAKPTVREAIADAMRREIES